ncbi:hypothetical protein RRG08_040340 [Elysia crispata]|uniref:Uncharacterized protein n=1 Tax=Elysia crispata TaxID=231223 RepID=A0AAE1AT82_9GAST|nr:hypothetical protein RRG08_040340 [Elysia crispata]
MEAVEAVEASQSKGSIHSPIIYYLGKPAVIKPASKTLNWNNRRLWRLVRVKYLYIAPSSDTRANQP